MDSKSVLKETGSATFAWPSEPIFNHCGHFPDRLRMLVIGASGSGKTALVLKLLFAKCPIHNVRYLQYKELIIVSPSLKQPEYALIIENYKKY